MFPQFLTDFWCLSSLSNHCDVYCWKCITHLIILKIICMLSIGFELSKESGHQCKVEHACRDNRSNFFNFSYLCFLVIWFNMETAIWGSKLMCHRKREWMSTKKSYSKIKFSVFQYLVFWKYRIDNKFLNKLLFFLMSVGTTADFFVTSSAVLHSNNNT